MFQQDNFKDTIAPSTMIEIRRDTLFTVLSFSTDE